MLPPDTISVLEMYQKCFCGRGSAPHPAQGAHSAPPDLLAGFPGPLYDRAGGNGKGRWWSGWNGEGKGRKEGGLVQYSYGLTLLPAVNV